MPKISSVLIANRGEICIRIAKTLKRLGIKVYGLESALDVGAAHLLHVDVAITLTGDTVQKSYLDIDQIVGLCKKHGIDAVHPGYGFLSENEDFAQALADAGIIFIGPGAEAIRRMGSKAEAKEIMIAAKVPTLPGYQGVEQSDEVLQAEAAKIGFPLLIKASAGGGGKGMRIVSVLDQFAGALKAARSEAMKSFGDDRVILEKYLVNPRHIEFQIFGDSKGNVIHLGERECSIQRRHQKIIEESPSPFIDDNLRTLMGKAAVDCGKALNYLNAGTVEFIVSEDRQFYFLEVNTRLQVEHPITEMVTGLDLVEWQIRVAQGEQLPLKQNQVSSRGHAIECRLYAEDPENSFLPSIGKLLYYMEPTAPFLRIDSGVNEHSEIGIYFDPMIAKVIVSGFDRAEAISRMIWALENYPVLGVKTNAAFLLAVLRHEAFRAGATQTHFIQDHLKNWKDTPGEEVQLLCAQILNNKAISAESARTSGQAGMMHHNSLSSMRPTPWNNLSGFRIGASS